jgi:hypothetical protein
LTSSTEIDERLRKMATRMPRPTTTSAAATAITKKARTWPSRAPLVLAKVTNDRLTAFSISSMHMNTTMALRRISTPATPMPNRMAESSR